MTKLNTEDLNRTVFISDNLPVLKSLDNESVDLVCIDPPFAKNQTFVGNLKTPLTEDEARIERELMDSWSVFDPASAYEIGVEYPDQTGTTAKFEDIWNFRRLVFQDDLDELKKTHPAAWWLIHSTRYTHSDSTAAYIYFMVQRVIEIKRVLKPTGSVFLHCDHSANAYLRQMMDAIFGESRFRNEIVWYYKTGGMSKRWFGRKHDTILFYSKSGRYTFKPLKEKSYLTHKYGFSNVEILQDDGGYFTMVGMRDVWDIAALRGNQPESTGYPTQKPQGIAKRIIEASTNPGDIVLDCFAGCAYVPVAAELSGRRWIACDMSPRAWTVVRRQFHKHPDLGIVTEGELTDDGVEVPFDHQSKVIRVRGPRDLPQRDTVDEPVKVYLDDLPDPQFKQDALESSDAIWEAFVAYWGSRCWYCDMEKPANRRELNLDHIEPTNRDGTNDDCFNRALACVPCNGDKRNKLTVEETINKALEEGRIATPALRDEVLERFKVRHRWAKDRWEEIKPRKLAGLEVDHSA